MRWIGVDVGDARVGLAVSDPETGLALPLRTVPAAGAIREIVDLVEELNAGVVVGWPLELTGREGRAAARVRRFVEALEDGIAERGLSVEVHRTDERLTTGLAEALLDEAGVHGRKRKSVVDQVAAVQILQSFLEELSGSDGARKDD